MTTASSLLMAAAIGIAAGWHYLLAFGASLLCVVVLAVFRRSNRSSARQAAAQQCVGMNL